MKKYVFEEYRDSAGIGTTTVYDTEQGAKKTAEKEWNRLCEADKKSYINDPAGLFEAYEIEITTEQLEAFDLGEADFSLTDLWTRDLFDAIHEQEEIR